jgi:GT2 family glycosyltransferase
MSAKTFVARPVNSVSEFNSQVDIIIPYYGQYERVTQLLESLFRLTRSNFYKVIVVDDCSPNPEYIKQIAMNAQKNANRLKQESVLITQRNESQRGFAGACRAGYDSGESPYVCFLNSDCIIRDTGWLRSMGETLLNLKEQGVRMVSPMTNNPVNGDISQKGDPFTRESEDVVLGSDSHLSMYCFMCHRELFRHVGGFLKEYPYGYFEDEEFAARLRHYGFKQAVCRSSWIHHNGESTVRPLWREKPHLRKVMEEENRARCIEDLKKLG